ANVRTPLNSPLVGANEYLSSGMASAAPTNSRSTMERMALTASPGVFAGGGEGIWLNARVEQQSKTKSPNNILKLRMSLLLFYFQLSTVVIHCDSGDNCASFG